MSLCESSAYTDIEILSRYISNVPQARGWEKKIAEGPPCVVLASPGFMQVGPSRELFELWAPDSRNGLIITGYSIEGTLARVSDKRYLFVGCYLQQNPVLNLRQLTPFACSLLDPDISSCLINSPRL